MMAARALNGQLESANLTQRCANEFNYIKMHVLVMLYGNSPYKGLACPGGLVIEFDSLTDYTVY